MIFWVSAFGLAALCAGFVLWPLWRGSDLRLERSASALAIFKDQLAEVDRDMARGLISDAEAVAARAEIKRRMLANDKDGDDRGAASSGGWLLIALAALVPLGGAGVYTMVGTPGMPSLPFDQRTEERQASSELNDLISTLRQRLDEQPDGGETRGWELLATTLMNQNRYDEAAEAWAQIVDRDDATSATWSQYAETLINVETGVVTPAAERAIEKALTLDETNPAATFYKAIALDQAGQSIDGRDMLIARINRASQPEPWMEFFVQEINRIGAGFGIEPIGMPDFPNAPRGPSQEDIEAATEMSAEEQQAFIRTMVDGLAERLKEEPDDLQGWLQLARAYAVLGERENALRALKSAQPLAEALPQDDPRRQAVAQGIEEFGG